jgi:predicted ATPase/transcriptional regulator with XRE-family HTH domain
MCGPGRVIQGGSVDQSNTFGSWVKGMRKRLDLTREELAECVGCSLATVEKIETGERRPSRQIASLLSSCLGVSSEVEGDFIRFARRELREAPATLLDVSSYVDRTHGDALSQLPAPATSFVGRKREVQEVAAVLRGSGARMVTVTGPPGIGKTRLSLQVAAMLMGDGIETYFVQLSAVVDPALVVPAIAASLGERETGDKPLPDRILRRLKDKRSLLVLDNFEQVIKASADMAAILAGTADLKLLVTSRSAVRIYGEHLYPLAPLTLPGAGTHSSAESVTEYEAIQLFVQRAAAANPHFRLDKTNAEAVVEICQRLEGLPLAIELAANWARVLSAHEILDRLGRRLDLLSDGAMDLPDRQRSLRGALDWSYSLLDRAEAELFRRLSVFSGGCTFDAICEVCWDSGRSEGEDQRLDTVTELVDKSLLKREEVSGETRFSMLETVREYAYELLSGTPDECGEAERRHGEFYTQLAERAESELAGARQGAWLARLEMEIHNFRAAMSRAWERDDNVMLARMSSALRRFWYVHGRISEGLSWLQRALFAEKDLRPDLRAMVLHGIGTLTWSQGANAGAERYFAEALGIFRELGDQRGIANMLNNLGISALPRGDSVKARSLHTESLAAYRDLGDRWGEALALSNLGLVSLSEGEYSDAESLLDESLRLRRELGDRQGIAQCLNNLGTVMRCMGREEQAISSHGQALAIFEELGDRWSVALAQANIGFAVLEADPPAAQQHFAEALGGFVDLEVKSGIVTCVEGLGGAAARLGEAERGATLLAAGAAARAREELGTKRPQDQQSIYEKGIMLIRGALTGAALDRSWTTGEGMSLEEAIEVAMGR